MLLFLNHHIVCRVHCAMCMFARLQSRLNRKCESSNFIYFNFIFSIRLSVCAIHNKIRSSHRNSHPVHVTQMTTMFEILMDHYAFMGNRAHIYVCIAHEHDREKSVIFIAVQFSNGIEWRRCAACAPEEGRICAPISMFGCGAECRTEFSGFAGGWWFAWTFNQF